MKNEAKINDLVIQLRLGERISKSRSINNAPKQDSI